jgi:hypothetical protein
MIPSLYVAKSYCKAIERHLRQKENIADLFKKLVLPTDLTERVPTDLLIVVCHFIGGKMFDRLSTVSKRMRAIVLKPLSWKYISADDFPSRRTSPVTKPFFTNPAPAWWNGRGAFSPRLHPSFDTTANVYCNRSNGRLVCLSSYPIPSVVNGIDVTSIGSGTTELKDFSDVTRWVVSACGIREAIDAVSPNAVDLTVWDTRDIAEGTFAKCKSLRLMFPLDVTLDKEKWPVLETLRVSGGSGKVTADFDLNEVHLNGCDTGLWPFRKLQIEECLLNGRDIPGRCRNYSSVVSLVLSWITEEECRILPPMLVRLQCRIQEGECVEEISKKCRRLGSFVCDAHPLTSFVLWTPMRNLTSLELYKFRIPLSVKTDWRFLFPRLNIDSPSDLPDSDLLVL